MKSVSKAFSLTKYQLEVLQTCADQGYLVRLQNEQTFVAPGTRERQFAALSVGILRNRGLLIMEPTKDHSVIAKLTPEAKKIVQPSKKPKNPVDPLAEELTALRILANGPVYWHSDLKLWTDCTDQYQISDKVVKRLAKLIEVTVISKTLAEITPIGEERLSRQSAA